MVFGSDDVKLSTTVPDSGVAELFTMVLGSIGPGCLQCF